MPNQPQTPVDPLLRNSVITLVSLLKHKARDKDLEPVISVAKFTDLLRGSTDITLSYQQLRDLMQDPIIGDSIKSINKNQIVFSLGDEEPEDTFEPADMGEEDNFPPPSDEDEFGDDEEFSPEDFESGEDESEFDSDEEPDEDEGHAPKKSVVSQMANRAMRRP